MAQEGQTRDLPILQKRAGDYPVPALPRLLEGRRSSAVGYIRDAETFRAFWKAPQMLVGLNGRSLAESMEGG